MDDIITFTGLDALAQHLEDVASVYGDAAGVALRAEAEIEMTEAKQRTPVRTGVLRDSGTVTGPDSNGTVTLSFGGAAQGYAIIVHEDLEMHHPRGGQAKFLESVILESAPYLAQRVAERIAAGTGGQFAPSTDELATNDAAVSQMNADVSE